MTHRLELPRRTTLVLALSLMPGLASSGLTDPTRPLAGAAPAEPATAGVARAAAPAAPPAPAPAEPQLQSLQLPRDGVASALVDGQLLHAGQRWNAFEIVAIDAQGVLAKGPGGSQRWTLMGVHYLDPKARARLAPAAPSQPALAASSGATSATPAAAGAGAVHTAQWQFTPLAAPPAAPALPPVTRLSWADLVAPERGAATVAAPVVRPAPTPPPAATAPAQTLRLPSPQARHMPVAAGPSRAPDASRLDAARSAQPASWRGLRFEWPVTATASPRQTVTRAPVARGPLRGPLPPSLIVARPTPGRADGARWTAGHWPAEPARQWWTPAPAVSPARVAAAAPATAPRLAAPRPTAPRVWTRVAPRTAPLPTYAVRPPLPPALPRTPGLRLAGVVALNKESP